MTNSPCSSRGGDVVRGVEVALGVRRVLEELAVVVPVALRRLDLRRRLEVEDPLLRALVGVEPPGRPDRQHEVVAGAVAERPEDRVADARRPRGRRASRRRCRCGRTGPAASPRPAGRSPKTTSLLKYSGIRPVIASPFGGTSAGLRQPMAMERRRRPPRARPGRTGSILWVWVGGDEVVEERAAAGEALDAEQLLGVEAAVGRAVLGVALAGHAAVGDVVHAATGLLGRGGQSRSIAQPTLGRSVDSVHAGPVRGGVPGDPHRREARVRPQPAVPRAPPQPAALQALLGAVRGAGRDRPAAFRLPPVRREPLALRELHPGLLEPQGPRRGDPSLDAVRGHPRLDGPGRAAPAERVRGVPRALLPDRVGGDPSPRRDRRQARRRRGGRPVHRRHHRPRSTRRRGDRRRSRRCSRGVARRTRRRQGRSPSGRASTPARRTSGSSAPRTRRWTSPRSAIP